MLLGEIMQLSHGVGWAFVAPKHFVNAAKSGFVVAVIGTESFGELMQQGAIRLEKEATNAAAYVLLILG